MDFTHSFGRFNAENESLEIEYLNVEKDFNYIINVIPAKRGVNLLSRTDSKITLDHGAHAYYNTTERGQRNIIVFMFEKGDWYYMLSIQESLLDKPLSTLTDIANSL
ncbi:hypothetical protein [Bacillus niameyensis]|uniref:hypothetical protein n=1 Tax=Bacillus niameyensis TaxID=1522308 RepID=UPI0007820898|nr:hypothetical protein [Bacillus niameyensis]